MTNSAAKLRDYQGPPIFSFGFRPFFLGGAVLAAAIPIFTTLSLSGLAAGRIDAYTYHTHEMTFGFLSAILAGFLLTAVPNWTGKLPITGWRLAALFGLWGAGRAAFLISGIYGRAEFAAIETSFLLILAAIFWREILSGRNWRNLPVCILVTLFALGDLLWHAESVGAIRALEPFQGGGLRLGLAVVLVLLALIGGRITPSFTRNWLAKSGRGDIDVSFSSIDRLALAAVAIGATAWAIAPNAYLTGMALVAGGIAHLIRLSRWGGARAADEALVLILHIGQLWLALGLGLLGASVLRPDVIPPSAALHALTSGAMGVMILAVTTRATLGHTGRTLTADRLTIAIYVLAVSGAIMRVAAPIAGGRQMTAILIASALWSGAFALFTAVYGRYLTAPRVRA
ncbi:MAG: NnrS family protein [Parvularculaceae bacterium]